ncbi:Zinc resistance conferring protein [Linderina macrospora]|uniref:Zinc resistance conferring protein n=1 Tax=Linderina macrospora TaxID=4868 RepID=A0ACC1J9N0_9FUNG|nr:Zinc resistance conferring protein [Linderina macrospora]
MVKLSRSAKVGIMLSLSSAMFFVELIVGILAGSITLVADSFHMLNDVLGMVIALWAIKLAKSDKATPNNTYGWQRAEILGALTNGVLLLGLCLTIYIDAIQRFIQIEEVRNPKLVMIVGCIGLTFNIESLVGEEDSLITGSPVYGTIEGAGQAEGVGASTSQLHHMAIDNKSIIGVPHPTYTQQAIIKSAHQIKHSEIESIAESSGRGISGVPQDAHSHKHNEDHDHAHDHTHGKKSKQHDHDPSQSGGHLNMQGVWVHVFGDCITNIAVIISGLVIWKAEGHWRFYFDPAMSILINTLVVAVTLPLVKSASFILLNGVPNTIDLEALRRDLRSIPNVLNIHDLHVWQLSDTKYVSSVHVLIDRPTTYQCIHNSNSSSEVDMGEGKDMDVAAGKSHDHQDKKTKSARLVTRRSSRGLLRSPANVDMDCVYMEVAAHVKRVMHRYGIHSATIQPEFVVGQSVSVATTKAPNSTHEDLNEFEGREGSIFSRVAIVPEDEDGAAEGSGPAGRPRRSSATIGPCLLSCRNGACLPGSCCPGEVPIKVVPGTSPTQE